MVKKSFGARFNEEQRHGRKAVIGKLPVNSQDAPLFVGGREDIQSVLDVAVSLTLNKRDVYIEFASDGLRTSFKNAMAQAEQQKRIGEDEVPRFYLRVRGKTFSTTGSVERQVPHGQEGATLPDPVFLDLPPAEPKGASAYEPESSSRLTEHDGDKLPPGAPVPVLFPEVVTAPRV